MMEIRDEHYERLFVIAVSLLMLSSTAVLMQAALFLGLFLIGPVYVVWIVTKGTG